MKQDFSVLSREWLELGPSWGAYAQLQDPSAFTAQERMA